MSEEDRESKAARGQTLLDLHRMSPPGSDRLSAKVGDGACPPAATVHVPNLHRWTRRSSNNTHASAPVGSTGFCT